VGVEVLVKQLVLILRKLDFDRDFCLCHHAASLSARNDSASSLFSNQSMQAVIPGAS
jgi:hypothetical protein